MDYSIEKQVLSWCKNKCVTNEDTIKGLIDKANEIQVRALNKLVLEMLNKEGIF